jgi:hypothetical protein
MHKKTDTFEFDIPKDDIECWERYPKYRWMYELSRLLDSQNIRWSPYFQQSLPDRELSIELVTQETILRQPGFIYIKKPDGQHVISEVYIVKGEIRNLRHFDPITDNELESLIGVVELRISAFVTLHFQKFTGVISVDTYANEILRIRLRPHVDPSHETNIDIIKLIKRIYKKTEITLNGPTDRVLHETLAS